MEAAQRQPPPPSIRRRTRSPASAWPWPARGRRHCGHHRSRPDDALRHAWLTAALRRFGTSETVQVEQWRGAFAHRKARGESRSVRVAAFADNHPVSSIRPPSRGSAPRFHVFDGARLRVFLLASRTVTCTRRSRPRHPLRRHSRNMLLAGVSCRGPQIPPQRLMSSRCR